LLEQAAVAVSAMPFVAAAYGLLYQRLDIEVTRPHIALARLPKAFEGFRIAQLTHDPTTTTSIGLYISSSKSRGGFNPLRCATFYLKSLFVCTLGAGRVIAGQETRPEGARFQTPLVDKQGVNR
jgi:hypothetical protein